MDNLEKGVEQCTSMLSFTDPNKKYGCGGQKGTGQLKPFKVGRVTDPVTVKLGKIYKPFTLGCSIIILLMQYHK